MHSYLEQVARFAAVTVVSVKNTGLWRHAVWQKLTKILEQPAAVTFTDEEFPIESEVKYFSETSVHF
jgi:hypothetical protein